MQRAIFHMHWWWARPAPTATPLVIRIPVCGPIRTTVFTLPFWLRARSAAPAIQPFSSPGNSPSSIFRLIRVQVARHATSRRTLAPCLLLRTFTPTRRPRLTIVPSAIAAQMPPSTTEGAWCRLSCRHLPTTSAWARKAASLATLVPIQAWCYPLLMA